MLKHADVTEVIIECFYDVYNTLGYGFLESVYQRAMQAELTGHLGHEKHDPVGNESGNSRNGTTSKKR